MPRVINCAVLALVVLLVSTSTWAIPPAIPRQYQPLPVNTNVFFLAYMHLDANTGPDESIPVVKSVDITSDGAEAVYLHYFDVGGKTSNFWASLPGAGIDANVVSPFEPAAAKSTSGFGQPVFGFNYGYKGAPAMDPQQFVCWQQKATFNAAFYVSPPVGAYDRDKLLNVSTNRWEFKPEFTAAYRHNKWLGEVYGNVQFFSDNTEFLGSRTLSQNPLYGLDAHLSYDFRPGLWASFDLYQRWGGKISVDDVTRNKDQNFTTLGFTLSGNVTQSDVVYVMYGKTISGTANPDFQSVMLLYGHLW